MRYVTNVFFLVDAFAIMVSTEVIVEQLQDSLAFLSVELVPVHQKLIAIRRQLVALAAKEGPHKSELKPLQEELRKIDSLSSLPPLLFPLYRH